MPALLDGIVRIANSPLSEGVDQGPTAK
jgi:hypothetical protein